MMRSSAKRALFSVVPALLAAWGLAACGSSKSSPTTDGGNSSGSSQGTSSSHGSDQSSSHGSSPHGSSTGAGGDGGKSSSSNHGSSSATGTPDAGIGQSVLTHHNHVNRDGMFIQPTLTKAVAATLVQDTGFTTTTIEGNAYAQPLFVDGGETGTDMLFVATESNNVYALNADTGAQIWTMSAGIAVPNGVFTCGGLNPTGITGAPVIDLPSRTMFFEAATFPNNGPDVKHLIFAVKIDTGAVVSGWPVDVTAAIQGSVTFDDLTQGERGALAIVDGTLYVPFGGRDGDCDPYHGWVVAVPIDDPTKVSNWSTTLPRGGIWAQGGVSSDGTAVYVATGNTSSGVAGMWGGGEGIVRFAAGTALGQPTGYFAPTNWLALDDSDLDLGAAPVLFSLPGSTPEHLAISFGKDGDAYLVDPNNLSGVGSALGATGGNAYSLTAGNGDIITAPAVYTTATATYVAYKASGSHCTTGSGSLATLKIVPGNPPTLAGSWCANGGNGSPIVTTTDGQSNAIVWNIGSKLMGFDGDTGATIFSGGGVSLPSIQTWMAPIVAKGRFFVFGNNSVVALKPM